MMVRINCATNGQRKAAASPTIVSQKWQTHKQVGLAFPPAIARDSCCVSGTRVASKIYQPTKHAASCRRPFCSGFGRLVETHTTRGPFMVTSCECPVSRQDADLERRIANFLIGHKIPALKGIEVHSDRGEVTLQGRVASFYQRQLCISCCRHVAGVIDVIDRIQVA